MSDLISRQAAIDAIEFGITYAKAINKETGEVKELFQASNDELRKAEDRIKQLPSAQPERKKGKWIYDGDCYICDQCKSAFGWWADSQTSNYCPNCGAKMDEEVE